MKHKWRYQVPGVKPETAVEEIRRLEKSFGMATPKNVVAIARPKTAPLHPAFEWEDSIAGEKYREHQASQLIRAVHVVCEETKADVGCAFVRVVVEDEDGEKRSGYISVERVADRDDQFASALQALTACLRSAQKAVVDLSRYARTMEQKQMAAAARNALTIAMRPLGPETEMPEMG